VDASLPRVLLSHFLVGSWLQSAGTRSSHSFCPWGTGMGRSSLRAWASLRNDGPVLEARRGAPTQLSSDLNKFLMPLFFLSKRSVPSKTGFVAKLTGALGFAWVLQPPLCGMLSQGDRAPLVLPWPRCPVPSAAPSIAAGLVVRLTTGSSGHHGSPHPRESKFLNAAHGHMRTQERCARL
jgi:hypothetical protein